MVDAADFLLALSCAIERGGTTKPAEKRNATKTSAENIFIRIDSLRSPTPAVVAPFHEMERIQRSLRPLSLEEISSSTVGSVSVW